MTEQRRLLEMQLLPAFGVRFAWSDSVVNIGAGDHPYREHFSCRYATSDVGPNCDERWSVEAIPYSGQPYDGVVFLSVLDRVGDPMQAIREIHRVLRPGGFLLFGTAGVEFPALKACERWRLTPGGVAHVLGAFEVLESYDVGLVYHYRIARRR